MGRNKYVLLASSVSSVPAVFNLLVLESRYSIVSCCITSDGHIEPVFDRSTGTLLSFSHSFLSRNHHSSTTSLTARSVTTSGRLATTTMPVGVKFLGPATGPWHPALRLQLASDRSVGVGSRPLLLLPDRQIVQSEPVRPKPQWSHGESAAAAAKNNKDDDGFDDILQ